MGIFLKKKQLVSAEVLSVYRRHAQGRNIEFLPGIRGNRNMSYHPTCIVAFWNQIQISTSLIWCGSVVELIFVGTTSFSAWSPSHRDSFVVVECTQIPGPSGASSDAVPSLHVSQWYQQINHWYGDGMFNASTPKWFPTRSRVCLFPFLLYVGNIILSQLLWIGSDTF